MFNTLRDSYGTKYANVDPGFRDYAAIFRRRHTLRADQFDKCPNTPAGTVVDGSGCPIVFPKIDTSLLVIKKKKGDAKA